MGETQEKQLHRGLRLARIITAALSGFLFVFAFATVLFFQDIKVSFQTGTDAQQLSTIKIKKGSKVDLPSPMKPGSYFLGWSLAPNSTEIFTDSSDLTQDTTLYAVWDGAEKYAVLSVNGVAVKQVSIFDTSVEGLTAAELNQDWRIVDDYSSVEDNPNLILNYKGFGKNIDLNNNFSRFLGWRYLNANNTYNELRYEQNAEGTAGTWTWIQRDKDARIISETLISDTNKFYPPNYRTTFTALLDYRTVNIKLYDAGSQASFYEFKVKLGEENFVLPTFEKNKKNLSAKFSHWELKQDHLSSEMSLNQAQPELAELVGKVKTRYEAGEVMETLNPLWYYYGRELLPPSAGMDFELYLRLYAVYWDNETVDKYTMQAFSDTSSGTSYRDFSDISYSELSVENPVACDYDLDPSDPDSKAICFWLYYNPQILSYAFYDHRGVYHVFNTDRLKETRAITIGTSMTLLGEEIYFRNEWGINVMVNYQSSAADVTVKFNYGNDLYLLPNYSHYENTLTTSLISRIGNTFEILSCEKYMKFNHIFTGWQIAGDESGRIYNSGEKFTVPNFDTESQSNVIEFVAVWHLQRLLFDFDFDGGSWATEQGPDFTLMKGAYGDSVRIIDEIPVKFGYNFVGWTLEDDTEMLHAGDAVVVGTQFQTLHAHWTPKRLRVIFYVKYDAYGNWAPRETYTKNINNETLYAGDTVQLPAIINSISNYYIFNGWQMGDSVVTDAMCALTPQTLSHLETVDSANSILEVHIYASQTQKTLNVIYDYTIEVAGNLIDIRNGVDVTGFETVLPQGDYFYDYYPFSVMRTNGNYAVFDAEGRQFVSWSYTKDNGKTYEAINANTRIPSGITKITVRGSLSESKSVNIEFYNHRLEYLNASAGVVDGNYNFGNSFRLPNCTDVGAAKDVDEWGTFIGWSFTPDYKTGNPDVVYDVYYYNFENDENPQLRLYNHNDTTTAPYLINIDRYAVQTSGRNYILRLYAIYANNNATVTYASKQSGTSENTELKFPVFSNGDYAQTKIGGKTVGYDSKDFAEYGITVLDDQDLTMWMGTNFVGWEAVLPDGVSPELQDLFCNKIWFPGEYLPSVDFSFSFKPIRVSQSGEVKDVTVGNRVYRVLSLSSARSKIDFTDDVDVVAFPRGNYTVKQGNIKINSNREVRVIVPADGNIVLEPRSIICNTIKEFYIGDNLTITGSPVVGANFQAYRVKKGYRLTANNGVPTEIMNASEKYDFAASMSGLLVSQDGATLYGVPCHTNLTTAELSTLIKQSITRIASYALSDINSLTTIDLSKSTNLQIDENAIHNGNARNIVLPASVELDQTLVVSPSVLSGALTNLASVTFWDGNENTTPETSAWYAFVDNGFIYYVDNIAVPGAKTHLMYALRTVRLNNLAYTNNNIQIADTVSQIEPSALVGLDWSKINSVTANNVDVDLTVLVGIPNNVPLFTSKDNPHKGPMIQPYYKTFRFVYKNGQTAYETVDVEFAYGQTFRVFNAQNNNYSVRFDRSWSQFVAWKFNGRMLYVGEVYKVGIDETIIGDKYLLQFDASPINCWRSYPVQFITYNDEYAPSEYSFEDIDGNVYAMSDLLENNNLSGIYLPGLNQKITMGTVEYQFIGWSTKTMKSNSTTPNLWNSVDADYRILPNRTANTMLNSGSLNNGAYIYYALYEKVTPNIIYSLMSDGTYAVTGLTQTNVNSLNIPFAKYNEGYMVPVSKISDNVFSGITNNANTSLNEISIGGAISEIGKNAFSNVKANQITFNQKGRSIYYNRRQNAAARQLIIGDNAFANNPVLANVVLPASVESLGTGAFQSCVNLSRVLFEEGVTPYLRNLGDFVFRGDQTLKDNAIVRLISEDVNKERFINVGCGIFMNTDVESIDGTNKIVWGDTLLHVYYPSGYAKDLTFNEKIIAGYAFADLGSDTDSSVHISIAFSNLNVQIRANAFSFLHNSVNTIYLNRVRVNIDNVAVNAFDNTVEHTVHVYTNSYTVWTQKFENLLKNSTYFVFH